MRHNSSPSPTLFPGRGRFRLGIAIGLIALGSCGQVQGPDPDPDGNTSALATFSVDAVYFGTSITTIPADLSTNTLKAWALDSKAISGFRELSLTFDGATASCDLPKGSEGFWQLRMPARFGDFVRVYPITDETRQWHAVVTTPGNQNAAAPPGNAVIDAKTTLTQPSQGSDAFFVVASGAWVSLRFTDARDGSTTYDPVAKSYSQAEPLLPGTPLYTITRNDRVYITRYRLPLLVSLAKVASFDLVGGVNMLSGAQKTVAMDRSLTATLGMDEVQRRLGPHIAAGATPDEDYWRIVASPDGPYPFFGGPQLTAGSATPTVQASYGNPFSQDGWSPVLNWVTSAKRLEQDSDGTTWRHFAGFRFEDTAPSGNRSYVADSGLPKSIALNGVALNTDKMDIAGGLAPIELSFTADRMDGELRTIECDRLDFNPVAETRVLSLRLVSDRIRIPASMLPPGKRYRCRMSLTRGVPKAMQGDDREREPTIRTGYLDSSSFIIR